MSSQKIGKRATMARRRGGFAPPPKRAIYNCECGKTAVFIMAIHMARTPDWMPLCAKCLSYEIAGVGMARDEIVGEWIDF